MPWAIAKKLHSSKWSCGEESLAISETHFSMASAMDWRLPASNTELVVFFNTTPSACVGNLWKMIFVDQENHFLSDTSRKIERNTDPSTSSRKDDTLLSLQEKELIQTISCSIVVLLPLKKSRGASSNFE